LEVTLNRFKVRRFPSSEVLLFLVCTFYTLTYSWYPVVACLALTAVFFVITIKAQFKFDFNFSLLFLLVALVLYTLSEQVKFIDSLYSILFLCTLFVSYCVSNYLREDWVRWFYFSKAIFYSCIIVTLFTFIVSIPQDFSLFIGERRGYWAQEFLFFGRYYEFSFGVTHLNIFINYILTFCLIGYSLIPQRKRFYLVVFILFFLLSLTTQSRSPILFAFSALVLLMFTNKINRLNNGFHAALSTVFLTLILSGLSFIVINSFPEDSRFLDSIRFLFFFIGIEHLIESPWGNSLIYFDERLPLKNYHNTFLSLGNRFSVLFIIVVIVRFLYAFLNNIYDAKVTYQYRVIYILLAYFCLHNFMIEDVFKFEKFVVFIFFVLVFSFNKLRFKF
jgi:hypothetical protein